MSSGQLDCYQLRELLLGVTQLSWLMSAQDVAIVGKACLPMLLRSGERCAISAALLLSAGKAMAVHTHYHGHQEWHCK